MSNHVNLIEASVFYILLPNPVSVVDHRMTVRNDLAVNSVLVRVHDENRDFILRCSFKEGKHRPSL